jgi:predicted transglutaminase-like cysteine proteinase
MLQLLKAQRAISPAALGFALVVSSLLGAASANTVDADAFAPVQLASLGVIDEQIDPELNPFAASLNAENPAAESPNAEPPAAESRPEPFGLDTTATLRQGSLFRKWHAVTRSIAAEQRIFARCRVTGDACPEAARRFLAVVDKATTREGRARIAEINRAINLNIQPLDDMTQHGVRDKWSTPLMTFRSGAGDCDDYAIAKYVALREIGFLPDDVRLLVVHDQAFHEDHAVTAVRYESRWLILDNRTLDIREDMEMRHFKPLFMLDIQAVKRVVAWQPK